MKFFNIVPEHIPVHEALTLYHCGYEQCKPSHFFGPAIRPHYLFHYIISGKGQYTVNGTTYQLSGGEGFLIMPGDSTFYQADEEDPWEYCWIGFDGYEAKRILLNCNFTLNNLIYRNNHPDNLKDSLMALIENFEKGIGNEFTYIGLLYQCFAMMRQPTNSETLSITDHYMQKALFYIHNHYTYDIKISDVARYIGIDRTYLYKIFMNSSNISPQQYLIQYRISMAEHLLKETNLSVTEIAYSCGFKDAPAFYKHFRKYSRLTPLQYRSEI